MATNLMHLRRLVRSRIGVPQDDDFMPDHVLDDHINLALQAVDGEAHWPWADAAETVTVTAAAPDIVPSEDWRATRAVFWREVELGLVAPADLLRWSGVAADAPQVWCPIGDVVAVRPVPSSQAVELTHYFYRQAAWLLEDSDRPTLPAQYTGAVVAKAAELLSARESSGGDASRHGVEYTSWISRMRRDMRRSTSSTRVRVRAGSWI